MVILCSKVVPFLSFAMNDIGTYVIWRILMHQNWICYQIFGEKMSFFGHFNFTNWGRIYLMPLFLCNKIFIAIFMVLICLKKSSRSRLSKSEVQKYCKKWGSPRFFCNHCKKLNSPSHGVFGVVRTKPRSLWEFLINLPTDSIWMHHDSGWQRSKKKAHHSTMQQRTGYCSNIVTWTLCNQ